MFFLPETPQYLVQTGRIDDAKSALGFLSSMPVDHEDVLQEIRDIQDNLEFERSKGTGYLGCWKPPFLKRQATGCLLQSLQQLTGSAFVLGFASGNSQLLIFVTVNFIIYYGTRFFDSVGVEDPFLATVIINVVAFVSTIPGLYLVERMGRRRLLLIGAAGMAVSQLIVAIVGVTTTTDVANKALIGLVCIYIFFFEFSWGP